MKLAQPKDHGLFPLLGHLDRIAQENADQGQDDGDGKRQMREIGQDRAADENDEDQCTDGIHMDLL